MIVNKIITSKEAPSVKDAVWKKPVEGGFALYGLDSGQWKPLKLMDDSGTVADIDDAVVKAEKAIQEVKVNGSKLTPTKAKAVDIKVETGAVKGLKVNGTDVAVKGLAGTGAFASAPAEPATGDSIVIFYNGTGWVDALGRAIS